jgi:hypothetical protein
MLDAGKTGRAAPEQTDTRIPGWPAWVLRWALRDGRAGKMRDERQEAKHATMPHPRTLHGPRDPQHQRLTEAVRTPSGSSARRLVPG